MNEINTEQRLRLINQIRQEHNQNRQVIQSRELIMYGNEPGDIQDNYNIISNSIPERKSTFGLRMLIAAILFVGYFFLESSNINIGTLDADLIRAEVNRYSGAEINLFDFMDNITYTFNND